MLALSLISLISGASALIFEGLWFRSTGLLFGNSVWASSLVTASFMAGLALGGGLTGTLGWRLARPLRAYALLETVIGATGMGVVLLLPASTPLLVSVFRPLLEQPVLLNLLRLTLALAVMVVPATAMGATLPVMVATLSRDTRQFGRTLGWIYGWNTLGGVVGVLVGEMVLIPWLGVTGTGCVAASLNGCVAVTCWALSKRSKALDVMRPPARGGQASKPLLVAAFVAGAILLALEVIWFRFLLLFVPGTSLAFAVMLSVILFGIAAGGLFASAWLRADVGADQWLPEVSLLAGSTAVIAYAAFAPKGAAWYAWGVLLDGSALMLAGAFLSGMIFTLLGGALRRQSGNSIEAAGHLTLANTSGAMVGSLLAGFLLLPALGIERSLFALALGYAGVAAATWRVRDPQPRWRRLASAGAVGGFSLVIALFPFGLLQNHHLKWLDGPNRRLAFREGSAETVAYFLKTWAGEPYEYRLLTNAHWMSNTGLYSQRYMKLYVYWAIAVNPEARHALLLCYGVGNTAKALVDTRGLESIDVVDISRDVLALSDVPYPPPQQSPLQDPRVQVHVEDGRFFLLTTERQFDLITAEPPPPKAAGITNLYSREYFELVRDRLADGGVVTYWLPVGQLRVDESQAIVKAFCAAFSDCSLWSSGGGDWMLAATRGARGPIPLESFEQQWLDPRVAPELRKLGFDAPEALGALFIADADQLAAWAGDRPPVEDGWPRRLSTDLGLPPEDVTSHRVFADAASARPRFGTSRWIEQRWPLELRQRSLAFFDDRRLIEGIRYGDSSSNHAQMLRSILTQGHLAVLPLLWMQVDPTLVEIAGRAHASGVRQPTVELYLAAGAFGRRDYRQAASHLDAALALDPDLPDAAQYRELALSLAPESSPRPPAASIPATPSK